MPTPVHATKDNFTIDEKLGIITHEESWLVDDLATALSFYPDPPGDFALVRRHSTQQEGGKYDIVFVYEGVPPNYQGDGEDFEMQGTLSEDPIETFPNQELLKDNYSAQYDTNGNLTFPQTLGFEVGAFRATLTVKNGTQGSPNPLFGAKTWLNPGLVWTHKFTARVIPPWIVQRLGSVDVPDKGSKGRVPPQLSGQRNWMLSHAEAEWRGTIWKISVSWMLSGKQFGGWNEDLYRNNPG